MARPEIFLGDQGPLNGSGLFFFCHSEKGSALGSEQSRPQPLPGSVTLSKVASPLLAKVVLCVNWRCWQDVGARFVQSQLTVRQAGELTGPCSQGPRRGCLLPKLQTALCAPHLSAPQHSCPGASRGVLPEASVSGRPGHTGAGERKRQAQSSLVSV